ncbi:oligosaccharide flippase family protein [Archangium sp.]|uniref:oligosaccharide flippase family protein n=1 Tax=Archangium sp. TaxID=1872627 RepID=UPI00286D3B84|nr:oligosaccharide flippase family protein [Archangium sp.]
MAERAPVDAHSTLRNALKLGGSLLVTYVIGFGLQVLVPRVLGPDSFGQYNWANGTAAAFFILSALGLDVYIRKEVALRREHASEFLGGTLLLQGVLAVGLLGALLVMMRLEGTPPEVRALTLALGVYQFFFRLNAILAAVLHAHEKVDGLSLAHILMKCLWGFGLGLALLLRAPLPWLAVPFVAAELVKTGFLFHLTHRHAGLRLRMDVRATGAALMTALPFFINEAALATNGRVDVFVLGLVANTKEVGYYGAVWGIAGLTMLLSPILGWVLLPMLSRAAASSEEEFTRILRRGLEGIVSLSVPVTLALALGAETWVHLLIGEAYLPAAPVLRLLAPIFVLTYVATVCASWLMAANRTWTVTRTSVLAAGLNLGLNLVLIPPFLAWRGVTGGASATATSLALCEVVVTVILVSAIGSRAWDARSLAVLGKTLGACAAVTAAHLLMGRLGLDSSTLPRGLARLVVDGLLYVSLILLTGAVRKDEVLGLVRLVRNRRKPPASTEPPAAEARAA